MDYLKIEQSVNLNIEKIAEKQKNLFEALIGAIYLDGGIDPVEGLLDTVWAYRKDLEIN